MRVIGLMSGTSMDGTDAALVDFEGSLEELSWRVVAFVTHPYTAEQRRQIHDAIVKGTPASLCRVHAELGEWFAAAALEVCAAAGVDPAEVDLIGTHGQTIWHEPRTAEQRGATLQLGDPATIAERTGIPVVSDFRTRDIAAGGEGAPLVPWMDGLLFSLPGRARALQNIGGIGNVTWVPPRGEKGIFAFDTGPGNALIDAATELASGGAETFDRDGHWARQGHVDEALLAELLEHPFYRRRPPKSTGREVFGRPYVEELARRRGTATPGEWATLIATLTALTARTIADSYRRWLLPHGVEEVVVTGGGARNPVLFEMIQRELAPIPVRPGEVLGLDPDAKEAVAFAALAWAHVLSIPGNVPEATGAREPRVLGSYTPGAAGRPRPV